MDTRTLILFSLVPTALGHLVNTLLMVPLLGTPLYLLMPWAAALFCLWAGGRCGRGRRREDSCSPHRSSVKKWALQTFLCNARCVSRQYFVSYSQGVPPHRQPPSM